MEKKVCTEIAEKTSSLGVAIRTTNEIKEKWNYLKKAARNVFTNHRQEQGNTVLPSKVWMGLIHVYKYSKIVMVRLRSMCVNFQ